MFSSTSFNTRRLPTPGRDLSYCAFVTSWICLPYSSLRRRGTWRYSLYRFVTLKYDKEETCRCLATSCIAHCACSTETVEAPSPEAAGFSSMSLERTAEKEGSSKCSTWCAVGRSSEFGLRHACRIPSRECYIVRLGEMSTWSMSATGFDNKYD